MSDYFKIGDYVRIKEYLNVHFDKQGSHVDRAKEGYITSIHGPYYRIAGEKDGYQEASLELASRWQPP